MAGEVGGDEPWVVYLNQEINESEKDSVDQDITIIIRDIIASTAASEDAIKNAAVRLDTKYQSIHNAVEPIVSFSSQTKNNQQMIIVVDSYPGCHSQCRSAHSI